ncbi:MAG: amidohydrolase [Pseudomonadales bacterium]|nr:amidohydrolase [Pseudomonadales bacterium]HNC77536.1 amidohydrolase [Pseudomonadales bacterium]HNL31649.1 amidohydrolase [Pseudomonadales bacterium]
MSTLTLALVQADLAWHDIEANLAHFDQLLAPLAAVDLIVLPEMFTTGFTMASQQQAEPMAGRGIAWLRTTAQARNAVVCGSLAIEEQGLCYNRFVWATPDGALHHYDKRHCFRMAGEHHHYRSGESAVVMSLNGFRIRPIICYDLRFPVWCRNRDDYDLLLCVANWPAARSSAWQRLLPARAIENLSYVAAVNRVGQDGKGHAYSGDSALYDWLGEPLLAAAPGEEALLTATLDLAALQRFRAGFPAHLDADPFEFTH